MELATLRRMFATAACGSGEVVEGGWMTTKNSRENPTTSSDNTSIASTVKFTLLGKNEIEEIFHTMKVCRASVTNSKRLQSPRYALQ